MSAATYVVGDVRDCLAALPDGSVDLILTSPPFLALRSYLPADHPNKHLEIGSEPTPAEFLTTLLGLTAEFRRVLAPHGSICVELGDTYSGSGGAGGDYADGGLREGQGKFDGSGRRDRAADTAAGILQPRKRGGPAQRDAVAGWPLDKSMCGIPHLYHLSLAYGRNLLTGEPCEPWRVRNVIAWCRPNPPVGALGDKFRPATSYMTIATVARDRYFDLDAVRTPQTEPDRVYRNTEKKVHLAPHREGKPIHTNPAGAPPLDWWEIPTQPYRGSHYAVFPPALLERPIKAMCPQRVCTVCGEPSRRIVERTRTFSKVTKSAGRSEARAPKAGPMGADYTVTRRHVGWSDCGHDDYRAGLVLDPFGGSGTTGQVATGHGRDCLKFDLDERNADLARERIGLFLTVHTLDQWKPATEAAS